MLTEFSGPPSAPGAPVDLQGGCFSGAVAPRQGLRLCLELPDLYTSFHVAYVHRGSVPNRAGQVGRAWSIGTIATVELYF